MRVYIHYIIFKYICSFILEVIRLNFNFNNEVILSFNVCLRLYYVFVSIQRL
jgi:hypothetical protein